MLKGLNTATREYHIVIEGQVTDEWDWRIDIQTTLDDLKYRVNDIKYYKGQYDKVVVNINSIGGSVFAGYGIYNLIAELATTENVECRIQGVCFSIASLIMLAAPKIYASDVSLTMIHQVTAVGSGTAQQLQAAVEMVQKAEKVIAEKLAQRMGKTTEEVLTMMQKESWFTASEGVDIGLFDGVINTGVIAPKDFSPINLKGKQAFEIFNSYNFLMTDEQKLKEELAKLKAENEKLLKQQVSDLLQGAVNAKKITQQTADTLKDLPYESVKNVLSSLPEAKEETPAKEDKPPILNKIETAFREMQNGGGSSNNTDKATWTVKDYLANDPKGLENMADVEANKLVNDYKRQVKSKYSGK